MNIIEKKSIVVDACLRAIHAEEVISMRQLARVSNLSRPVVKVVYDKVLEAPHKFEGLSDMQHVELSKLVTNDTAAVKTKEAIATQTMLHGAFGVRDCAILAVFFSCGLRRNEITTLTLKNINYTNKLLFIKNGKGNKDRVVPIAKEALELIKHYKNTIRPSQMTFESGDVLFLDNIGKPYRGGQISELIRKHKKRAGISKPGASNLYRHTTATTLLDNGADLLTVQNILGHASVSTTQVYTHIAVRKLSQDYQANHPSTLHPEVFIPAEHPIHQQQP
jgi:integrase/recombinase XerD